jgi:hypothetical protein
VLIVVGLGAAAGAVLLALPPTPQPLSYHDFADQRTLLGVPSFFNVVSNVPFVVAGVLGVWFILRDWRTAPSQAFRESRERWPFLLVFLGVGLTGFGSAYYHLEPTNDRLVWDRLPMAVAFMSLFAAVLGERLNPRLGLALLIPLVAAGVASVWYWHWTEHQGRGDLRFYLFVQLYPLLAIPLLLLLFPPRYTRTADYFVALGWYAVAKVCESPLDGPVFALGGLVSGHTLKHLTAATGAYWIWRMLMKRRPEP